MECNCNNNNSNGGVIPWVRGNRLPLIICVYENVVTQEQVGDSTLTVNEMTRVPYTIQDNDTVTVIMKSGFRQVEMPFTTDGNKVMVTDNGELPTGAYTVEVTIERGDGARGRWQETRQVRIYENTSDAQLGEMYSIDADLFFYAKGDTGTGIADITNNPDGTLTITMTDGTSYVTEALKGDKGDKGDTGERGVSIVSFDVTGQTDVSVIYTVTFSDDTTQDVAVPKGPQGDTGLTGNGISTTTLNSDYTLTIAYTDGTTYTTPSIRGAQGAQGVSVIGFTQTGETATNTMYNLVFSDGRTQSVAIPKGVKGDKGDTGATGATGAQGPKGDTVTATDYTLYNVQGSDSQGAMSQDATTKAISAQTGYYTCGTAAGTPEKVVTVESGNLYKRTLGGHFKVKMTNKNTAASGVTLQIGSETAAALWYNGAAVSASNSWEEGEVISVYYDGSVYQASNAQGGGGNAEKIKYDNSQSGLAATNVQGALDTIVGQTDISEHKIFNGFQVAANKASTTWYATSIGFEKGKKYHIRVTASTAYANATAIILQLVSQQFEGQKNIGTLPANSLSAEFDYSCVDDGLQYFCIYASGSHTVTYGIVVSEYLEINEAVNKNRELLCPQATYINFYMGISFVIATGPLTRAKYYTVQSGQKFRIKANSTKYISISFLTSLPETLSNNQDLSSYKVGSQISIAPNTEKIIEIPATAGIMWVNVSSYYQGNFSKFEPEYVSIIDEGNEGFDDISKSNEWIVRNGAFFGTNGKYVLSNGCAFKYIPVQVGEKYIVVTNSLRNCNYALMRSIPETITHWGDIDAVGYGLIPNKKDLTLEIPSGCNYLAVSVANVYQDYEPSYVGKLSSAKSLNDNTIINTALINNVNAERILLIPVYGQSLAIGGDATPITTYCRFPKNCANNTTLGLQFGQSLETSIYGLVESYIDFKGQEDRIPASRQTDIIASFSSGQGSTPISGLIKGTTLYTNLISSITSAYNARNGIKLIIPAFCWIQGEGDIGNGVDYYYNALSQLRSDLDTDIKAITGQTEDVHCIVYQTNQLCPSPTSSSYYNPTAYASGGSLSARMDGSVVALWKLVKNSQYFHVSSPIYPMDFVVSSNNAIIHISGVSQKLLGYYEGLAAKRLMDGHGDDIGLYVTNVTKVDNTHIRLSLHVPAPPIVVDTESVYETANYGFSVINENSQNIISAVSIERNNLDSTTILITTSADCTNAKVRYGVNGTHGYSGFDKGPRGNIRDSQGLWYKAVINNRKVPMHNWLLFFEYLIN